MGEIIRKEHNVSTPTYHIVCPATYRRAVITEDGGKELRDICLGIEARYEIQFLESGTERDRVHIPVPSEPTYGPERMVRTIKSITAGKIYERCPEVKEPLWGGEFRTRGCYVGS
ncbi:MAG: IS200/IS605 family transposase, partial [Treponema sp.]|nr:IS200/IS605 family transposase [Treponema sp.]